MTTKPIISIPHPEVPALAGLEGCATQQRPGAPRLAKVLAPQHEDFQYAR